MSLTEHVIHGTRQGAPATCASLPGEHSPGYFDSWRGSTPCICSAQTWRGDVGTCRSRTLRDNTHPDHPVIGFDVLFSHAAQCQQPGCASCRCHCHQEAS